MICKRDCDRNPKIHVMSVVEIKIDRQSFAFVKTFVQKKNIEKFQKFNSQICKVYLKFDRFYYDFNSIR